MIGARIHEGTYSPEKDIRFTYQLFTHEDCHPHRIRQNQETGFSQETGLSKDSFKVS